MKYLSLILFVIPLFGQQTLGVIDFKGKGVSKTEASALTDRFASELFKLNIYTLVERDRIGEILTEQGFQQSGCTTSECAVELGKMLGTELIITGAISKVGNVFSVASRIVNVESGKIEKMSDYDYQGEIGQLLIGGMENAVKKLVEVEVSVENNLEIFQEFMKASQILDEKKITDKTPEIKKDLNNEVEYIPYDDPPVPLTAIRPKYPEFEQEAGIEGTVIVQVFISKKGIAEKTNILRTVSPALDKASVDAITGVKWRPAKRGKSKIGVWISVPINFRLAMK